MAKLSKAKKKYRQRKYKKMVASIEAIPVNEEKPKGFLSIFAEIIKRWF